MSILLRTHKILWGRSGSKCAMPDCKKDLFEDETQTDDISVIGDEAHIVAREEDGPRGNSALSREDRDKYENLILLCKIHHKIVDDQPDRYTVERLKEIKNEHETWVKTSLNIDDAKVKDDISYSSYIDKLTEMLCFENWNGWTSFLLSAGQPHIYYDRLKELEEVPKYLISRFWPDRYPLLKSSIFNLKNVLTDLLKIFYQHANQDQLSEAKKSENNMIWTEKFYKNRYLDEKLSNELYEKFEYHVDLVQDLTVELTRAANFVIENTRKYLFAKYREDEGKLLFSTGPDSTMSWKTYVVEYRLDEKKGEYPYGGLEKFMTERSSRDFHFGNGVSKDYFPY